MCGGLGPHIRCNCPSVGKGSHAAGRDPCAINKSVHAQSKWLIVEKNSAREEFVSRSQPRVRVNKIGHSASKLGTHVKRKRSAETKKLFARDWQRFVFVACGEKGSAPKVRMAQTVFGSSRMKTASAREVVYTLRGKLSA